MSTFSTAMNATSHYQNPNPNPNQAAYSSTTTDQLNELLDFELSDYVAFDGEFEEEISTRDTAKRSENVENNFNGSLSSSTPLASNIRKEKNLGTKDEFRFAFRTKSKLEIMDDGFKWRKYGKKMVKNSPNPRNYFKCTSEGCSVKKRVERDRDDPNYVITTYEGMHNHQSPDSIIHNQMPWTLQPSSSLQ
ncbi:probable WRKY transcription factor 51 [Olea europaea subsp. europaea]|uniref:Probable WRKY transcription factor 51 n=1 Tax=Olea europaea subsp. europaea TaxID=158383 RepID=A0A8S0U8K2_OLEEU|nr:probable WRKY transcription factor 51 [Olea europaea subsp. europaea]